MDKKSQAFRIIHLYDRLLANESINKSNEAKFFKTSEKTIQRDIEQIRAFLELEKTNLYLDYDRLNNYYFLSQQDIFLSDRSIYIILKILFDSKALPKSEMFQVVENLLQQLEVSHRKKLLSKVSNERFLYDELSHQKPLVDLVWELSEIIDSKEKIKVGYKKEIASEVQNKELSPVGIVFSEFYFYLIAYEKHQDYPKIFRVDRIQEIQKLGSKFKIQYKNRFEEAQFKRNIQFMHTGQLIRVKFLFKGRSVEAVLDRLPTAQILSQSEQGTVFEAEVYQTGLKMWILSQGETIEVLEPIEFKEELIRTISKMKDNYK